MHEKIIIPSPGCTSPSPCMNVKKVQAGRRASANHSKARPERDPLGPRRDRRRMAMRRRGRTLASCRELASRRDYLATTRADQSERLPGRQGIQDWRGGRNEDRDAERLEGAGLLAAVRGCPGEVLLCSLGLCWMVRWFIMEHEIRFGSGERRTRSD